MASDEMMRIVRAATSFALFVVLFIALVRVGDRLEYFGSTMWAVVFCSAMLCAVPWLRPSTRLWHLSWISLRGVLIALAVMLALITWNGGDSREEVRNQGRDDRVVAAVLKPGMPSVEPLRSVDDVALSRLSARLPEQVAIETRRRADEAAVRGAAMAEAEQRERVAQEERQKAYWRSPAGQVMMLVGFVIWMFDSSPSH